MAAHLAEDARIYDYATIRNPFEAGLVRQAIALGAADFGGPLSEAESLLVEGAQHAEWVGLDLLDDLRRQIGSGLDPLGDALCQIRPQAERRLLGAFYTPNSIVDPMVEWILARRPSRVIDAGCGSGRFACAVASRVPDLPIVAVDIDPLATLITRASLAVHKTAHADVLNIDYTRLSLPPAAGSTAFIGNPPYVRHHSLPSATKAWAALTAQRLGHPFSNLAGLHAHFFLATAVLAKKGDIGSFVTSAEWLDVGYGSVIRSLLVNGLGAQTIQILDRTEAPFDAQATAVVTCFEVGSNSGSIRLQVLEDTMALRNSDRAVAVSKDLLRRNDRWSSLINIEEIDEINEGQFVRLGQIFDVHRGVVTGANDYFILTRERASALGLASWCRPAITDAREILDSGGTVRNSSARKVLLVVPRDVDRSAFPDLDAYLKLAEKPDNPNAIVRRYITSHRKPWWHLGPLVAPPVVASYMARQAPGFALNPEGLALLNIGHGLYPKRQLAESHLRSLVSYLNGARERFRGKGRTYQGGLEKFEPREMESLLVHASLESSEG